jgi:hypothetical protein
MKKIVMSALFALGVSAVLAADVIEVKERKDWAKGAYVKQLPEGVWQIPGSRVIYSGKAFKVDPAKKYTVSFDIRKSADTQKVLVYAGFVCRDDDMVRIDSQFLRCESNSDTKLTADAAKGSNKIRIMLPKRWKNNVKYWCVSMKDRKSCGGLDMEVIGNVSQSEQAADGSVEITIAKPLTKDYPAGTAIHFHSFGPGMYSACSEKNPSTEWETVSATVSGMQTAVGFPKFDKWWLGTKYAKLIFVVSSKERNSKIEFRNIKVTIE